MRIEEEQWVQATRESAPADSRESIWTLAAFWVVAFTGAALFAAVMISPRWEQRQFQADRVRVLATQCTNMSESNGHLQRVIDALKHDPDFTEEMARSELGYVVSGEQRIAAPVRSSNHPKPSEFERSSANVWDPFVRLFAHDQVVRKTALISAAVFIIVGLTFFNRRQEHLASDRFRT